MANFWWGMQCWALHISWDSPCAMCMCILSKMFSKHSAASSINPNWKRCWSEKLSASAFLRASGGKADSLENCSWENSSCNKKQYILVKWKYRLHIQNDHNNFSVRLKYQCYICILDYIRNYYLIKAVCGIGPTWPFEFISPSYVILIEWNLRNVSNTC